MTHTPGGGGIAARSTDVLRLAYMLLREGRWGGSQIVPAAYVRQCGRPSPYNPHYPYTLQFEINADGHVEGVPRDAYWKSGSGGHAFYIVPSMDLVIFKLGGRDDQYETSNTGLTPDPDFRYDGSREGWKPVSSSVDGSARTLQLVVSSVLKR